MAVLTSTEVTTIYLPGFSLTGASLTAAISRAQFLAESDRGADRPLEVASFSETLPITWYGQTMMLARLPILTTPAPVIRVRAKPFSAYGRYNPVGAWATLTTTQYEIDQYLGKITIVGGLPQSGYIEAQVTYSSGWDFTSTTDEDVLKIKQCVANIIQYQNPDAMPQPTTASSTATSQPGLKRFTLDRVYTLEFSEDVASKSFEDTREALLEDSLRTLQKYNPRAYMG